MTEQNPVVVIDIGGKDVWFEVAQGGQVPTSTIDGQLCVGPKRNKWGKKDEGSSYRSLETKSVDGLPSCNGIQAFGCPSRRIGEGLG